MQGVLYVYKWKKKRAKEVFLQTGDGKMNKMNTISQCFGSKQATKNYNQKPNYCSSYWLYKKQIKR